MQKILIVINHMNVGGIQKSLLELLKVLSKEKDLDVSLFCCKKEGAFLERIPSSIHLLPENPYARMSELSASACKREGKWYYLWRMVFSAWSKCFTKALPAQMLCSLIGKVGEEYDIAISFSQPIEDHAFCNFTNEIALHCVKAKKKVTFLHCDFGSYGGNTKRNRALYRKFDRIAAVSDSVGRRFSEIMPDLADRVSTVYNVCDVAEIRRLAEEQPLSYQKPTVVTVARLSEEKGLLRCVPIFARLKEQGVDVQWHIVGGGPLELRLRAAIINYHLEDAIILEGQQINPYRFLKNADYLFLPSHHEAAPIVFDEAMALGVPILSTETLSAREMVAERGAGLVCENNEDALFDMLQRAFVTKQPIATTAFPDKDLPLLQFKQVCSFKE